MHELYETQKRSLTSIELINRSFPAHLHQAIEVLYLLEGSCTIEIDGTPYPFESGDMAITFPYHMHKIIMNPEIPTTIQCVLCPIKECGEFTSVFLSHIPDNPVIPKAALPDAVANALGMVKFYRGENEIIMRAYTHLIFAYCTTILTFSKNQYHDVDNNIEKLTTYISNNLSSNLSLDTLSRNLGINRYDISRIFNTVLKTSLPVYINSLRLDKASHLLRSTSLSVTTIALECGYDSLRNFNRQFSKNYDMSPRTYRTQNPNLPSSQEPSPSPFISATLD